MELIFNYEVNEKNDNTERIITEMWTVSRGWWKGKKSTKEEEIMMRNVTKKVNEKKEKEKRMKLRLK